MTGVVQPSRLLKKSGLQPDQVLVLTKPVGTGVIMAAGMRGRAKGRWITGALEAMQQSNGATPLAAG